MKRKVLKKKKNGKKDTHRRSKYVDNSVKFVDWVNTMGIEKTYLGKFAYAVEKKFNLRRFTLVFLFSLVLSLLITSNLDFVYTGYKENDLANAEIKSPMSFEFTDEVETALKKRQAEESIPVIYDLQPTSYEPMISGIYKSFSLMRKELMGKPWPRRALEREDAIEKFNINKSAFEEAMGGKITTRQFEWLAEKRFQKYYQKLIVSLLDRVSLEKIIGDRTALKDKKNIIVRVVELGGGGEEFTVTNSDVIDINQAKRSIKLSDIKSAKRLSKVDKRVIRNIVKSLIKPNLSENLQETADRRQKARESVLPVVISIKKNQVIVSEGSLIQPEHVRVLDEISRRSSKTQRDLEAFVMSVLFVSMILVFFGFLRRFSNNKIKFELKDLMVMGVITLSVVGIAKISLFLITETLQSRFGALIPPGAYKYLLPVASGPMLVGLLIYSGEIVWLFTVFLAIVLTFLMEQSFPFLIVTLIGGVAGARGVHNCKKRNDIYFAGLRVGIINATTIALVTTILYHGQKISTLWNPLIFNCSAGFLAGIFASLIAMMFVPLLESVFNYTTDVKLLELSNLNHPLLKEMSVKASGTYHHSLVVGSMVEAAAEEIGANPLLGRVSCYFHDIGKTEHAAYFIENQRSGNNPHDHLSPHMSRTILIAHVKDGVELGLRHKLGKPIIDVIEQHHGTTLISFFYNRAIEEQDSAIDEVREDDFRYPGPKPQIKESALCMLADSIEAASRTIEDPNPMRVRNVVKTIIQRKFMDGQLDQCNLTLRDLSLIENTFVKVLLGIYHQRVDYPKHLGGISASS